MSGDVLITDAVDTAVQSNHYVYGNASWKDKLTTCNGEMISREPSVSKQYSLQPNGLRIVGAVLLGILAGISCSLGMPMPNFAY